MATEKLLRINKFKLEKTAITTYNHDGYVYNIDPSSRVVETNKVDSLNVAHLKKNGNFYSSDFILKRDNEDDPTWDALVVRITAFNGLWITFTPDTIDTPSENRKVYFWAKEDKVSMGDSGNTIIYVSTTRLYSEGNDI